MIFRLLQFAALPMSGILCIAGEPSLTLTAPLKYQVHQRTVSGEGRVPITGKLTDTPGDQPVTLEAAIKGTDQEKTWQAFAVVPPTQDAFEGKINLPGGGWYTLELRARIGDKTIVQTQVEPIGVGEVFVIAGQSNSANHGEEKQKTRTELVASFDGTTWRPADDPQPGASGRGGSFVPPFGDAMAKRFNVPVGIVSAGVGATSVREWLPRGSRFPHPPTLISHVRQLSNNEWESRGLLFDKFVARLRLLGPGGFRAVLWHQGESDANQRDPSRTLSGDAYQRHLTLLIRESRRRTGWEFPWFVALASYHTPDDPGSEDLRAGQKAMWKSGIALEGPDTDTLTGNMRDNNGKGVHFSGPGLRAHGRLWAAKVAPWLEAQTTVQVFLLAGQSNMQGQGVVDMDHVEHYNGGKGNLVWAMKHSPNKEKMNHLRSADGEWVERDDVEISFKSKGVVRRGNLTIGFTGYGGSSHIGPELQFGHVIGDHFDAPVLLIKTAWGGKSLQKDFRPPGVGGDIGPFYEQMISEVREALAVLGGRPYRIAGFVWLQGWNDMISEEATAEYESNLVRLAAGIRNALHSPQLPFVVGELGNGGPAKEGSGMARFRDAQERGTKRIDNALFVKTHIFALPKELSPNRGHGHHWFGNAESYFFVGDALAKGMLRLLDGTTK